MDEQILIRGRNNITAVEFCPGSSEKLMVSSDESKVRIFDKTQIFHKFRGRNFESLSRVFTILEICILIFVNFLCFSSIEIWETIVGVVCFFHRKTYFISPTRSRSLSLEQRWFSVEERREIVAFFWVFSFAGCFRGGGLDSTGSKSIENGRRWWRITASTETNTELREIVSFLPCYRHVAGGEAPDE